MARRNEHSKDEIKQMALTAAKDLIEEKGLQSLSARKIAQHIGYTVGTLYLVFKNFDDLLIQTNIQTLQQLQTEMSSISLDNQQAIYQLATIYSQFSQQHAHQWSAMYEHIAQDQSLLNDAFQQQTQSLFQMIEQSIQPHAPQANTVQITTAARALWGGVHGICILAASNKLDLIGSNTAIESIIENLISHYLKGLNVDTQGDTHATI